MGKSSTQNVLNVSRGEMIVGWIIDAVSSNRDMRISTKEFLDLFRGNDNAIIAKSYRYWKARGSYGDKSAGVSLRGLNTSMNMRAMSLLK